MLKKPRPNPPKAKPAADTLSHADRSALARNAQYVGSPHHTDIPKFKIQAAPRVPFMTIEEAEAEKIKNPDCLVCPRKWVKRQRDATSALQRAITAGAFVSEGATTMPSPVWVRDPDDISLVYEAKLCEPPSGYKAYPLTSFQVIHNLPFALP